MKKLLFFIILFLGIVCNFTIAQTVKLIAAYDGSITAVKLSWNMINSNTKTSYVLLKSTDGTVWTEAVKDRMLRKYSSDDSYIFTDRYFVQGNNYYRIKIADSYNNTLALSPIVVVNIGGTTSFAKTPTSIKPNIQAQQSSQNKTIIIARPAVNSWIIYPNPATDILKLAYKGSNDLKGVVNVQIQNESGKTVIKFRSGSMYKNIEIPVSNLHRGAYFIQVTVQGELMMSQRFIKQ